MPAVNRARRRNYDPTVPDIEQLAKLADALPVNQINEFPSGSGSPKWWAEYHKVASDIAKMTV